MGKTSVLILLLTTTAFLGGFFTDRYLLPTESSHQTPIEPVVNNTTSVYTCPMHPHIHEKDAGDCPVCGMPLVEQQVAKPGQVTAGQGRPQVFVSPRVIHNFGIKTARVERNSISHPVRIYGYVSAVAPPEGRSLIAPVEGRITTVKPAQHKYYKDEVLIEIESEDFLNLQKSYLAAVSAKDLRSIRVMKQKFVDLGVGLDTLKTLVKTRTFLKILQLRAPDTGHLRALHVKPGQQVHPQQSVADFLPIYAISTTAQVFESQWIWLQPGQAVTMSNRSHPGVTWHGELREIEELGQSSTTAVRLVAEFVAHPSVAAKPGMQAQMTVATESRQDTLIVPSSAVIRTGSRNIVVVAQGKGHFQPVDVELGLVNSAHTEILSGLEEGMEVVISGQFLLDSESDINAEMARFQPASAEH